MLHLRAGERAVPIGAEIEPGVIGVQKHHALRRSAFTGHQHRILDAGVGVEHAAGVGEQGLNRVVLDQPAAQFTVSHCEAVYPLNPSNVPSCGPL